VKVHVEFGLNGEWKTLGAVTPEGQPGSVTEGGERFLVFGWPGFGFEEPAVYECTAGMSISDPVATLVDARDGKPTQYKTLGEFKHLHTFTADRPYEFEFLAPTGHRCPARLRYEE